MKNSALKVVATLVITLLSVGAFCPRVSAQGPISGDITWAGGVSLNSSSAATATQVTGWHSQATPDTGKPEVQNVDGNWASFISPGDGTLFVAPWSFNSGPVSNFWSVDGFTFDLTASVISNQGGTPGSDGFVFVSGTGTVSGNGFTPTAGTFRFSTQDPAAGSPEQFSFSAAAAVPEARTAFLLGIGGLGIALITIRRKRRQHA